MPAQHCHPATHPILPRPAGALLKMSLLRIIHVVIDDLGAHDVGYLNHQSKTPALDLLRAEGVDLPEFYTYKTCSPSRASLLTGRYPFRLGLDSRARV